MMIRCRPGAGFQAGDGTLYVDDGSGEMEIADEHFRDAMLAGVHWISVEVPTKVEQVTPEKESEKQAPEPKVTDDKPRQVPRR
jgi:hypothetical protein